MTVEAEVEIFEGEAKNPRARALVHEHTLVIEYCAPCNYLGLVIDLSNAILGGWGPTVESIELRPTNWGTFEVKLDGETIFSKFRVDRHAKPGEVLKAIEDRLGEPFDFADHAPTKVDAAGMPFH